MTLWYFPKISQLRLAKHSWTEQRHRRWPQCSKHGFIALRGAGIEGQTPRKIGDVTWSWSHLRNNSSKWEAIHDYTVNTTTTMVFKLIWHNQTASWCIMRIMCIMCILCIMGCRYGSVQYCVHTDAAAASRPEPLIWDPVEQYMEEPLWFETWGHWFSEGVEMRWTSNYTTSIY